MKMLWPVITKLLDSKVRIYIMTRQPQDQGENLSFQAEDVIGQFERMGIQVFVSVNYHHRKLALIDRDILW